MLNIITNNAIWFVLLCHDYAWVIKTSENAYGNTYRVMSLVQHVFTILSKLIRLKPAWPPELIMALTGSCISNKLVSNCSGLRQMYMPSQREVATLHRVTMNDLPWTVCLNLLQSIHITGVKIDWISHIIYNSYNSLCYRFVRLLAEMWGDNNSQFFNYLVCH